MPVPRGLPSACPIPGGAEPHSFKPLPAPSRRTIVATWGEPYRPSLSFNTWCLTGNLCGILVSGTLSAAVGSSSRRDHSRAFKADYTSCIVQERVAYTTRHALCHVFLTLPDSDCFSKDEHRIALNLSQFYPFVDKRWRRTEIAWPLAPLVLDKSRG